ncbi:DUF502 domain-containing protein [Halobellus limi]|uniref:DUF502 domain-containing protein n=1 Tax=Halobellus limi TaxID=699433 RepID=A0A1H6C4S5_9EURY|nr:DUF502 domain-containing protein [Halobellus limi]QCC48625.1 DUF502 domain-containing protein [Halobellus limi]SEG67979.1 Uncharacterized membrane protein [Halobellus limi]
MKLSTAVKSSFFAGLILITPLVVTLYVLRILVNWSLQFVNPVVRETRLTQYTANIEVVAQVLAVVVILGSITVLGYLAKQRVGREMFGNLGRIVNVIPLVSTIYVGVRQVANSLVDRDTAYESVVLVEYPRKDVYSIGLVTGESPTVAEDVAGERLYNVFLPHSPNPTAGRLVLLPDDQIHEVDMSVRRGMRLIVTSGIGADEKPTTLPRLDESAD